MGIKTEYFDFTLPDELLAAYPSKKRGDDRLLVLERKSGQIRHHDFNEIVSILKKGDILVFNDVRVRKCRIFAGKTTGGRVEILLLRPLDKNTWLCLLNSSGSVKTGDIYTINENINCRVESREEMFYNVSFDPALDERLIEELGNIPLPPYIVKKRKKLNKESIESISDELRYQTVFADKISAAAAPTAGLHFTEEILEELKAKDIACLFVTLDVGWGTFAPIKTDDISKHTMHAETYRITKSTADQINKAKAENRRVIAVGTTVARTLEASCIDGRVNPGEGNTDIFISPGYEFKVIDAMITNFHTPCSSLLVMISAFAGRDTVLDAYKEAIKKGYRFYSYGDAMFIE